MDSETGSGDADAAPLEHGDPAAELLGLTRALRTELERRAWSGRRRFAAPGELPPLPALEISEQGSPAEAHPQGATPNGGRPDQAPTEQDPAARGLPGTGNVSPGSESAAVPDRAQNGAPPSAATPPSAPQPQPELPTESRPSEPVVAPAVSAADAAEALPWAAADDPTPPAPIPVARPAGPPTREWAAQAADLPALAERVAGCRACGLCETRQKTVFADGNPRARVMFVGEAPGADEDRSGTPFVGVAGQLLSKIIAGGMGLDRERDTYIANVLKCRPPGNRDPQPGEKQACTPYLERQIQLVDPVVVIPLGRHAAQHLLGVELPMGKLRGRVHRPTAGPCAGRVVVPTYHPSYLLRSPSMKKPTWEDIQLAMGELGLPVQPNKG